MPGRQLKACSHPRCPALIPSGTRYCQAHSEFASLTTARLTEHRESKVHAGGYGVWRRIRERVLRQHGIPREAWKHYDVDHTPPYNPAIEPNHLAYKLTPMFHRDHAAKTCSVDGGFGNRRRGGVVKSLQALAVHPVGQVCPRETSSRVRGYA